MGAGETRSERDTMTEIHTTCGLIFDECDCCEECERTVDGCRCADDAG